MTCGREGDRHPFTEINLQDEFVTPITLVLNYMQTQEEHDAKIRIPEKTDSQIDDCGPKKFVKKFT